MHDHADHVAGGSEIPDFDERAATWDDDPSHAQRAERVAATIREAVDLRTDMRMLEYGAGTGLLSEALANDVGPIMLTDPSAGMREVISAKIASGRLTNAQVGDLDLMHDPIPPQRYGLIVLLMSLHHVPDVAKVLAGLAQMLDPGGILCIADLDSEDGSFHGVPAGEAGHEHAGASGQGVDPDDDVAPDGDERFHVHHGFDRDQLAEQLILAGLVSPRFFDAGVVEREGRPYDMFLAVADRASGT